MKGFAIRDLYESFTRAYPSSRRNANKAFVAKVMGLVEGKKLRIEDFSFKELWEALVVNMELEENLSSSAFPNIAAEIISKTMIEAYQLWPKQGLGMVRVVPSRLKTSLVPGWTAIGVIRQLREKEEYPEITPPDEKTVQIRNYKYGGILSLTKECLFFDQTGDLINRARGIGEEAARYQDQLIMEGLIDINTTVYNLGQLYVSGNSNVNTGAGSALGSTGWEAAYIKLLKKTDEKSKKIWVMSDPITVMVPPDLAPRADKLNKSEYEVTAGGALSSTPNFARNKFATVVNPYQTVTTRWHMGSFKRQFRWEEVWPLETYSRLGAETEEGFKNDIVSLHKASFYGGIGADDYRYVEQNNGV